MSEELAIEPVEAVTDAPAEVTETPEPSEAQTDETAEAPAEAKEEQKPELTEADKIRHAMQKRIDRLTAKSSAAEQQLQEVMERLKQFDQPKTNDAPKEDDFETVEDYLKAVGKWEAKQEAAKAEQERRHKEIQAKQQEIEDGQRKIFDLRADELRKTTPDFDDTAQAFVEELAELKPSEGTEALKTIIRSSPLGADLIYHLGKNPDVVESLKKTDTVGLARTLFRIEYDLEKAPKPQPSVSPKPPRAVGSKSNATKSLAESSPEDIVKWASQYK